MVWLLRLSALLMLALLVAAVSVYPAPMGIMLPALLLYAAVLYWRPQTWLVLLPAMLPVLDFSPWTGWFYLEDFDLMLLTTLAIGYWRTAARPAGMSLPAPVAVPLTLFALIYMVAAWRGLMPLPPLDANAFADYTSRYNSLRIFKGVLWLLLLLPLLRRSSSDQGELQRWLVPGMLLGLTLACLGLIYERKLFPGLLNFSSDYRPTGTFAAMHTGGAALDAYLAMAFPFVAAWILHQQDTRKQALGLACMLLGAYGGLTTFSRDIYLAYASSAVVLAALFAPGQWRRGQVRPINVLIPLLLLAMTAYLMHLVFINGGYRALLAALGLMGCAVLLAGARPMPGHARLAAGLALLLLLACIGLNWMLAGPTGKGAYLGYALAALSAGSGAVVIMCTTRHRSMGLALLLAALPPLSLGVPLVAHHWGGAATLPSSMAVVTLALLLAASRWLPSPPLRLSRGMGSVTLLSAIVLLVSIPIGNSYYTGVRFSTMGGDLQVRLRHWAEAIHMMRDDSATKLLGMGLGTYPAVYISGNLHGETPGTFRYGEERKTHYLRLGAPKYEQGYGEVLRMIQRLQMLSGHSYTVALSLRRPNDSAALRIGFCERWLIYPQNCVYIPLQLQAGTTDWVRYASMVAPKFGQSSLLDRPIQMEIANEGNAWLDITDISVVDDGTGQNILANGNFAAGNTRWFFSSDHNHFPWHIKNFAVSTVFETGWIGAGITLLLLGGAAAVLLGRAMSGAWSAAITLAALSGVMMVGAFDSIVDVPRLTMLLLLLICAGTLTPLYRVKTP